NRLSASFYSTKGDPLLGNRQSRLLGPDFLMPIGTTTHRNSSASTVSSTVSGQGAGIPLQIASLRGGMGKAFLSSTLSPTMLAGAPATGVYEAMGPSGSAGAQVTVFGPQRYIRTTGAPNEYRASFTLPPWAIAPFVLHIQNGDATTERVSSAWIVFNGVQIAGPADFSPQVATLDIPVSPS